MYEEMYCMHKILHVGKNIENYIFIMNDNYCIGVGISGKTNENLDMVEYVVDADECDQQPYEERDKATSP